MSSRRPRAARVKERVWAALLGQDLLNPLNLASLSNSVSVPESAFWHKAPKRFGILP